LAFGDYVVEGGGVGEGPGFGEAFGGEVDGYFEGIG